MFVEAVLAALKVGLPVAVMSFIVLAQLRRRGDLNGDQDFKEMETHLKELNKARKSGRETTFLHAKWMQFGGGFYGCTALWTFFVIEFFEVRDFLLNFPGFDALLAEGVVGLLVGLFVNQLLNFIEAIVWFTYWGERGSHIGIYILVAYLGYLAGASLARRAVPA